MLILEGPDGAGKTTLAGMISNDWGIPIAPKVVASDTSTQVNLVNWVDNNLEEGLQWTLFDRHRLISEPIYGTIVRNEMSAREFLDFSWLSAKMQQFYDTMPVIVYCLPPLRTIKNNLRDDPNNTVVSMYAEKLYAAYATRAAVDYALSPANVVIWDYTHHLNEQTANLYSIINELDRNTNARTR